MYLFIFAASQLFNLGLCDRYLSAIRLPGLFLFARKAIAHQHPSRYPFHPPKASFHIAHKRIIHTMAKTPEDANTTAAGDATAKRGRGRPPSGGVKKVYVPSGKPRGRPPTGKTPKPAYVPTGKPRGRPKGSGAKPAAAKATPKKTATSTGRPRGRPSSAAATPADEGGARRGRRPRASDAVGLETPTASKRKGRGRKSNADAAEEQLAQEDQDANAGEEDEEDEDAEAEEDVETA
ncbi:hypothetical protein CCM_05586 [Cordyceps militaris CM01]|uniref:AT hook-like protein n=2 Tax=Cordyceps militaris TaxID=73501 RepID=G3JKI9_CORMM|nr:uncharacterized protein CCM_05586 [Cordyceps militaris CM01]EGX91428.1 hypothetical protein CCM_05586 [Cordyceps militaris CM01]